MTEHTAHAPHHKHVRAALDAIQEKHAALVAAHYDHAKAAAILRAERIAERAAEVQAEVQS